MVRMRELAKKREKIVERFFNVKFLKLIELCFRQDIRYDINIYIPIYTI